MKKVVIGIVIVAMVALVGFSLLNARNQIVDVQNISTYNNPAYGISFTYPSSYEIREAEVGTEEEGHYMIVLMDAQVLANIPPNSDGPPAITIDFFQNDFDKLDVENWIKNATSSNYKLSPDGILTATSVAGKDAVAYTFDGLYRGDAIVFSHGNNIAMFSVSHNGPDDQIKKDFAEVLSSIVFQ